MPSPATSRYSVAPSSSNSLASALMRSTQPWCRRRSVFFHLAVVDFTNSSPPRCRSFFFLPGVGIHLTGVGFVEAYTAMASASTRSTQPAVIDIFVDAHSALPEMRRMDCRRRRHVLLRGRRPPRRSFASPTCSRHCCAF